MSSIVQPSLPFSWPNYFVTCWSNRSKSIYSVVYSASHAFRYLKAFVFIRFRKLFEGWLLRKPRRKALLIGIRYSDDPDSETLAGPHQDVQSLKRLLINIYGYEEADIVVMLDGPGMVDSDELVPTRANILRQIQNLVEGAESGDRFVFHFSGHSTQFTNTTGTEDDGMDEALCSSDGGFLIDNMLKQHLVDPLPVGSTLVAIFDTCHSASLLDLPHHRCNRVYVPWVSRAESSMRIFEHRRIDVTKMASRQSSLKIRAPTSKQPTLISVESKHSHMKSIQEAPPSDLGASWPSVLSGPEELLRRTTSPLASRENSASVQTPTVQQVTPISSNSHSQSIHMNQSLERGRWISGREPSKRYTSPSPVIKCDGWKCQPRQTKETAVVLALGAAKDSQNAWEDQHGQSMTAVLVALLENDPHPCLNKLMKTVSHKTYETICKLHTAWKQWEAAREAAGSMDCPAENDRVYETLKKDDPLKIFQDPQLASHMKLDMNMPFSL